MNKDVTKMSEDELDRELYLAKYHLEHSWYALLAEEVIRRDKES